MNSTRSQLSNLVWSLGPLLGLVLVALVFGAIEYSVSTGEGREPQFFTPASTQVVLNHASLVGVAALGMTLIIIAGGIDLSAGTAIALTATVIAWLYREGFDGMADWRETSPLLATLVLSVLAGTRSPRTTWRAPHRSRTRRACGYPIQNPTLVEASPRA